MINGAINGADGASLRHFLDLSEMPASDLRRILETAFAIKRRRCKGQIAARRPLIGKVLAMIFDKPSTRTRVSFDIGMRELGGETIMLTGHEMQLGRGETIADTARVLSRFVDGIVIRVLDPRSAERARTSCRRAGHQWPHQKVASLPGDGRYHDLRGASRPDQGSHRWPGPAIPTMCSRAGFMRRRNSISRSMSRPRPNSICRPNSSPLPAATQTRLNVTRDPYEAVRGADAVVSDCWVSMGDEDESFRHNLLTPYQVNAKLMSVAAKDAIFMHCLPAHRGEEVTDEVIDGPQSVVFDEAENRLHAQKGILSWCFGALEE